MQMPNFIRLPHTEIRLYETLKSDKVLAEYKFLQKQRMY